MQFRIEWNPEWPIRLEERLSIRDSADGMHINVGDDLYIISSSQQSKLLARLKVQAVAHDTFRSRIDLVVGGPRTAMFFINAREATPIQFQDESRGHVHREAISLSPNSVEALAAVCGNHDFSRPPNSKQWSTMVRRVESAIRRARVYQDPRPALEIAEGFLRRSYVTSQLPGPAPVYQNAARLALGMGLESAQSQPRSRHELTDDALQKAINEDIAAAGHTPNTQRHQEILTLLRDRLVQLGLSPKYDGLVDCIVECEGFEVYFEVKSASPESVIHQVRLALGQVLHYMWMDSDKNPRPIRGHLVIEGPWHAGQESLRGFLQSQSIRLTWSQHIPALQTSDL